jgi:hypothetical protein
VSVPRTFCNRHVPSCVRTRTTIEDDDDEEDEEDDDDEEAMSRRRERSVYQCASASCLFLKFFGVGSLVCMVSRVSCHL